jgi:hypothetical protein
LNKIDKLNANQKQSKNKKKKKYSLNFITAKDYGKLNPYEAIEYDKRRFFTLLYDILKAEHPLFNIFFNPSVIDPLWLRVMKFYLNLILIFALSAFFFSDNYIDSRAALSEEERVLFY